jgi:hypothetical protein
MIVAVAFQMHAAIDRFSPLRRIQNRRLKLFQFVAMRPWLIPIIQNWSANRGESLRLIDGEEGLRRGFITDTMHDKVCGEKRLTWYLESNQPFCKSCSPSHKAMRSSKPRSPL